MKHCIVNADDFGLSPGVCRGIVQALEQGVVTAASAMVCADNALEVMKRHLPSLQGRLGLHLQLTKGVPCLPAEAVSSLVDSQGRFPKSLDASAELDPDEVLREFQAQVQRLQSLGVKPSHLDSHHHVHKLPQVFPAYCRLARELELPARGLGPVHTAALQEQGIAVADVFLGSWFKDNLSVFELLELTAQTLPSVPEGGCLEIMTHPGYADSALRTVSSYTTLRETELNCLCSAELRKGLEELGLRLSGPDILKAPE